MAWLLLPFFPTHIRHHESLAWKDHSGQGVEGRPLPRTQAHFLLVSHQCCVDSMGTATRRPEDSRTGGVCHFQSTRHQPGQRATPSYLQYFKKLQGNHQPPLHTRARDSSHSSQRGLRSTGRMLCPLSNPQGHPTTQRVQGTPHRGYSSSPGLGFRDPA